MKLFYLIAFFVLLSFTTAFAQSDGNNKKKSKVQKEERGFTPSSRDYESSRQPSSVKAEKAEKKFLFRKKKSKASKGDKLVEEYHQRMEANSKKYKKRAKEMKKPQYSDPSYFGHKKKPKKRPVGKRKFCKECGIVH